jgi:dihydroflavonol-4-reductase
MKVLIAGGTGLIGYYAALAFLSGGDTVRSLSIRDIELSPWYPEAVELIYGDVFTMPEDALIPCFKDCDAFVYALGPDDRVKPDAPAYEYFHERLVERCAAALRAARKAGIKKCVVLNSYFAFFDRLWPHLNLAKHHPYIECRIEQAEAAIAEGGSGMDVCVLELPYIFGTMPGRVPLWKDILVDRLIDSRVVFYPRGGSAMIAVQHVAEAVFGAVRYGTHGMRYTIGDVNMEWKEMLGIMLRALGLDKKIVYLPKFLMDMQGKRMQAKDAASGKESGLDLQYLFGDIQCRFLYLDPAESRNALGYGSGGIETAIAETAKKCL